MLTVRLRIKTNGDQSAIVSMVKVDDSPVHSAGKACVLTLKASAVKNVSAGKGFGLSPKTEAPKRLDALIEKSAELSKCATHLPYRKRADRRVGGSRH